MKVILKRNFFDGRQLFRARPSEPIEMPDYLFGKLPETAVVVKAPEKAASEKVEEPKEDKKPNGSRDFKRS